MFIYFTKKIPLNHKLNIVMFLNEKELQNYVNHDKNLLTGTAITNFL